MGDLHSVAITPFSTMGAGGPRLSMKNSMFNTVRSRIGIKTSETAAKRYGVATLPRKKAVALSYGVRRRVVHPVHDMLYNRKKIYDSLS